MKDSTKKYVAAQAAFIANFNLKVGDKVKITHSVKDNYGGWDNVWSSYAMNPSIGKELSVKELPGGYNDEDGINLSDGYYYPYFVIQVLDNGKERIIELDSGEYEAEISKDGMDVTIGCQDVSFDTVKKIYDTMVALQKGAVKASTPKKVAAKKVARKVPAKKSARKR